jgi:hypothetical protein
MNQTDLLKSDFRNYLYFIWKQGIIPGDPDPTAVQYDIAHYLQHGPRRLVIEAFRGVGKSWITSAFVTWLLLNNPRLNILVVSASKDRADAFSTFTKRLIHDIPLLNHLKATDKQRNSNIAFDVGPAPASHSPSVKSVGITGQLTGSRADVIIADDVESYNNSLTQIMRDQLSERVKEFDAVLKPDGRIIYLGTPQSEMSMYNQLPERGYQVRIWPARIPTKPENYKGFLAPMIQQMIDEGKPERSPTDPGRFNETDLQEREASYGRSGFALQFMLDTTLSDADKYPLKISDLMVIGLDKKMAPAQLTWSSHPELTVNELPNVALVGDRYYRPMAYSKEMAEYTGSVMSIDPSGRGKDETAYAIVKVLHGYQFVVACGGFKDGFSESVLSKLSALAKEHEVNRIIVEANFGDGMFVQLLKPHLNKIYPVTVEEVRHSTQKERRIADTLEPVMNSHRLIMDPKVIKQDYETMGEPKYSLIYQMTRLTRDRGSLGQDDRLDALAMAVSYWVEVMARDTEEALRDHKTQLLEEELDKFSQLFHQRPDFPDRSNSWMSEW